MSIIIAAHITGKNVSNNYLYQSLLFIAKNNPTAKINMIVEDEIIEAENNISVTNIGVKNKITFTYWHNFILPSLLKKYNANCFITNHTLCNPKINIAKYYFIGEDLGTIKKTVLTNIQKSTAVFVTEDFIAQQLENKINKQKLKIGRAHV